MEGYQKLNNNRKFSVFLYIFMSLQEITKLFNFKEFDE